MEKEIKALVNKAIPLSDCPLKQAKEKWQRDKLAEKIRHVISDKRPFDPRTETK
jgi:hypothetical protein